MVCRFGHTSLAQPSACVARAIRAYFLEGEVPIYGTTCDSDPGFLFPKPSGELGAVNLESHQDVDTELEEAS